MYVVFLHYGEKTSKIFRVILVRINNDDNELWSVVKRKYDKVKRLLYTLHREP